MLKNDEKCWKKKVLGMGWPGGQNVRTPWGSGFMLSRGSPGPYTKKIQKYVKHSYFLISDTPAPISPVWAPHSYQQMLGPMYMYSLGPPWGHQAVADQLSTYKLHAM